MADSSTVTQSPPAPLEAHKCLRSVEPNCMNYTDDTGAKHAIYIPKTTGSIVTQLYLAKNWTELNKFPPYDGQGYDDWDNDPVTYADFIAGLKSRIPPAPELSDIKTPEEVQEELAHSLSRL